MLTDLLPDYLSAIPGTGIGPSPAYQYVSGDRALERYHEPWVLTVPCSSGFSNWDEIIYYSSGEYPTRVGNDSVEQIGDWEYVHE